MEEKNFRTRRKGQKEMEDKLIEKFKRDWGLTWLRNLTLCLAFNNNIL